MMKTFFRILFFVAFATVGVKASANDDAERFFFNRIISEDNTNLSSNYV